MFATVEQNEIVLAFFNGTYRKFLLPGKHFILPGAAVTLERYISNEEFIPARTPEFFFQDPKLANMLDLVDVKDNEIALYFRDGHFVKVLTPGKHGFWKMNATNTFANYDKSNPVIPETFQKALLGRSEIEPHVKEVQIESFQQGLLFFDGKFEMILEPGKYYFFEGPTRVHVELADMRQQQLDMTGQEIMTHDKVTLRLNFVCQYKVIDPVHVHQNIKEPEKQLYILLQLILREYVGTLRLDELLEKKEETGAFILEKLNNAAGKWGMQFIQAGIKDIILPGEIKEILNKVIEAEKRAQANVITRREETASTRSLMNTAKLMEDNSLLLRLKQWEYVESIAAKIGSISVSGSHDIMQQLGKLLSGEKSNE